MIRFLIRLLAKWASKPAAAYVVCNYVVNGKVRSVLYKTDREHVDAQIDAALNASERERDTAWAYAESHWFKPIALLRGKYPTRRVLLRALNSFGYRTL